MKQRKRTGEMTIQERVSQLETDIKASIEQRKYMRGWQEKQNLDDFIKNAEETLRYLQNKLESPQN